MNKWQREAVDAEAIRQQTQACSAYRMATFYHVDNPVAAVRLQRAAAKHARTARRLMGLEGHRK